MLGLQLKGRNGNQEVVDETKESVLISLIDLQSFFLFRQKRKAQNRASQRAFRERKQDYLASLEQKVLAYESAEVTKTIELQKIARGVNEENEKLKEENLKLKRICQDLQSELNRLKEGSTGDRFSNQVGINAKKRNFSGCKAPFHESRSSSISLNGEVERISPPNHGYENPNGGLSPDSSNSGESFPLDGMGSSTSKLRSLSLESNPNQQRQQTTTSSSTSSPHYLISPTRAISGSNSKERMVRNKSSNGSSGGGLKPCTDTDRDCGFCTESSPCVCAGEADLDLNEGENESITASNHNQPTMSVGSLLGPTSSSPGYPSSKLRVNYKQGNGSGSVDQSSSRLVGGATKPKSKLWEIHSTSSSTSTKSKLWPTVPAQFSSIQTDPSLSNISSISNNPISISLPCSGDPSTCSACSTDPGLAAFCEAINRNLDGTLSSPAILDVGNSVRIRSRSESQGQSSFKNNPFDRKGNDDREPNSINDSSHIQNKNRNGTKLWPSFPSSSTSNHLQRPSLPLPLPLPSTSSNLSSFPNPINSSRPLPPPLPNRKETIPEAWAQIRSHPRFNQWGGGLSLLADVVSGRTSSSSNQSGSSLERRRRAPSVEINHHDETFNSTNSNTRPILQRKLSVTRGTGNTSERNNGDSRLKLVPLSSLEGISDRDVRRSGNEKIGNDSSGGDSETKDLTQKQQQEVSSSSLRDESEEDGGERGSKRRRLYVETDAVRDVLALLDRGLPPREEDENGGRGFNEGRRPSLPCPCPWKPST